MRVIEDAGELEAYLEDAAHYPGGHCGRLCFVRDEADVAAVTAVGGPVLAVGAQSSLTGGATPRGGTLISTARMNRVLEWRADSVRVGPGLVLAELESELRERGLYYPPAPTYDGATIGGTVATNAAGAATFKYGSTRNWVCGLTVVLASGEVLDLRRGEVRASAEGFFEIETTAGALLRLQVPGYAMPRVAKCSAGYYAEPGMDLIDLFIGSEGTLGVVTEIELRLLRPRPEWFAALVPLAGDAEALALVADLREASQRTRASRDPSGIDVASIEFLDRRCLELLAEDGAAERAGVAWPTRAGAAIILQAELAAATTRDEAFVAIAAAGEHHAAGRPSSSSPAASLEKLAALLDRHGVLETAVPVLPGETARRDAVFGIREAAPEGVNRRIAQAKRDIDPEISKVGGDVIVPFERLGEALATYRRVLSDAALDYAIWGHISDGNLHPNVIPRSRQEMDRAEQAQLAIGEAAIAMGGCPMSEHGVGRNPIKQELLRRLYGAGGVEQMRVVKAALDPYAVLAPGVVFDAG